MATAMPMIDISLLGDRALERELARLPRVVQRRVVARAIRAAAYRVRSRIVANIDAGDLILSGRMRAAFSRAKVRQQSHIRALIRIGPIWPTRAELGIAADDPWYYPTAVEFGHSRAPAHPFVVPAVDENRSEEIAILRREIGAGIKREAARS